MIGEDMQVTAAEGGPKDGMILNEKASLINTEADDSDEEDIIAKKPTRRKAVLEDSDEDETEENTSTVAMTTEESRASDNDDDDDDDGSDKENNPNVLPKHVTKRNIISDDDDDDDDDDDNASCADEDSVPVKSTAMRNILKNDLFDAETDDEDEPKKNDGDSDSDIDDSMPLISGKSDNMEEQDAEAEDSDDEPVQLSAAMMRKLKKGAAKKPSKSSKARVKKDELQSIHSETQRIVRESAARVPYHQPKPLGLSVFLARTQQKQQQLNTVLKNTPRCTWKTAPGLAVQPKTTPTLSSPADLLKPKSSTIPKSNLKDRITAKLNSSKIPKPNFDEIDNSQTDKVTTQSKPELAEDELPDITNNASDLSKTDDNQILATEQINLHIDATQTEKVSQEKSQTDDGNPVQDSGFLSGPSSEEENSLEKKTGAEEVVLTNENQTKENKDGSGADKAESQRIEDDHISSTPTKAAQDKKSFLTPKLVGLKLDNVTPSLSKGPADFIDLDDDEDVNSVPSKKQTPHNPGIASLMDRLMKHSVKKVKKKGRDVEMSVVRKEKGEAGKEELKLEKMVVHLDSDEEDEEMKRAEAPGAKLQLLKQKLTAKMREKREEERRKRNEIEAMDNEDGFLDDGDEEAELTDRSDSEKEEEPEEEEEEEMEQEEIDDDGYTETEKKKKENNPFVDDEAEDEDGDDEDGEEDEMKLELEASDGETETAPEAKDPKQFIKKALYKTKTMELFDDEALSESPVASQEALGDKPSVSNRPFESLSQARGEDQASEGTSTADNSLQEMDSSSIANEIDNSADSSFDLMGTLIPAGQRTGKKQPRSGTPELYDMSSKSSVATSSTYKLYKSTSAMSELALPIEDTQDLLQGGNSFLTSQKLDSQELNFHLEDSQTVSQMLDDDGLLKVKYGHPQARRQLHLDMPSQSQGMDELLGLCSGKFTGDTSSPVLDKKGSLFSSASQKSDDMSELLGLCSGQFTEKKDDQSLPKRLGLGDSNSQEGDGDMDELLALCSGQFTGKSGATQMSVSEDSQTTDTLICSQPAAAKLNLLDSPLIKRSGKRKKHVIEDEDEDEFEVVDGKVEHDSQSTGSFGVNSDDEDGQENENSDGEGDGNEQVFKGFKSKAGGLRKEFVDDEAELSGSEAESDEDLDIAEEDDILEEELGDREELPSDDELRNQVNRVHLKTMIDSDKRELQLLQEMYLEDGDLHSDGTGRQRKFRWKNVDEDSQQDMFGKSDEEDAGEEEEGEGETKWRMERYEREKFLKEQEEEGAATIAGNSTVLKLGITRFKRKSTGGTPVTSHSVSVTNQPTTPVTPVTPSPLTPVPSGSAPNSGTKTRNVFKVPSHGSFLTRNKATLDKISEMTKPVSNNISGPKDSRGFVFAQLSEEEKTTSGKKTKVKKPPPPQRSNSAPAQPPSKKPKIDKASSLPSSSIFHLI